MLDFQPDLFVQEPEGAVHSAPQPVRKAQAHKGRRNHLSGQSAEDAVLRDYLANGLTLVARRFRSAAGEIDLILRDRETYVFVEVKSARTWDAALCRISPKQVSRIHRSAEIFVSGTPEGPFADVRFDAALCDQKGQVSIMSGALLGY